MEGLPQRYEKHGSRKGQSLPPNGRGTPAPLASKANSYTYSKPQVSKFSPMLLGKYKYPRNNIVTKSSSPLGTPRSSHSQHRSSLPSIIDVAYSDSVGDVTRLPNIANNTKDADEAANVDKMSDSGISCTSSIPRNLSSSSMASSQSSVDNQNKPGNEDDAYLDALDDRLEAPEWSANDPDGDSDNKTRRKAQSGWTVGPDKETTTVTVKPSTARPANRHFERDKFNTPRRLARTQIRQQFTKSKTLPRIPSRTSSNGQHAGRTKTAALADGTNRPTEGNRLHPIAEATHTLSLSDSILDSITEHDSEALTPTELRRTPKMTPKAFRAKKNSSSAPNARTPVEWSPEHRFTILDSYHNTQRTAQQQNNSKPSKKKLASAYKSPYSIESTKMTKSAATNPWPRTRVGDFVLSFPWNEATRKASGTNFDMKTIIREQQKMLKKLIASSKELVDKNGTRKRRASAAITKSEAIELSFMLKFEDKDANPLYFWGPQNPPLLSSVLS